MHSQTGEFLFLKYSINDKLLEEEHKDAYEILENFILTEYDSFTSYKLDKEGNIEDIIEPHNEDGSINMDLSGWRPKITNFQPKESKWKNPEYDALMNSTDVKGEYFRAYMKYYQEFGDMTPENSYRANQLISMQNNWGFELLKNPSLAAFKTSIYESWTKLGINIHNDSTRKGLKLMYTGEIKAGVKNQINALIQKRKVAKEQDELDKIDIELSKLYNSIDLEDVNTNMTESLLNFMDMTSKYRAKNVMDSKVQLILEVLSDVKSYNVDYFTGKMKHADKNKIIERLEIFRDMQIYDELKKDGHELSAKAIDKLDKLTSITGLGFSFKASMGNTIFASVANMIEGAGGMFYNIGEYIQGQKYNGTATLIKELTNKGGTKTNSLMDGLGLFEKYNPVNQNDVSEQIEWRKKMTSDVFFIMSNASEYYVQSSVAVAMMLSHRVVNGKIININEFKGTKEEFEKHPTFWDSVEYKGGNLIYKENLKSIMNKENQIKDEVFLFTERIKGVTQKVHGRYTQTEAAAIQQHALGRMLTVFRRWIPAAIEERFSKKHYDMRLRADIEGRYVTMARFVSILYKGGKLSEMNWENLTPIEKRNVKAMLFEVASVIVFGMMARFLSKLGDDLDDEDEYYLRKFVNFNAYMSNRVTSELIGFYSFGLVTSYTNVPLTGLLESIGEFSHEVITYPFKDDEKRYYTRGTNKGRLKIEKEFADVVPIWKDISFYNSLDTQGDYFYSKK